MKSRNLITGFSRSYLSALQAFFFFYSVAKKKKGAKCVAALVKCLILTITSANVLCIILKVNLCSDSPFPVTKANLHFLMPYSMSSLKLSSLLSSNKDKSIYFRGKGVYAYFNFLTLNGSYFQCLTWGCFIWYSHTNWGSSHFLSCFFPPPPFQCLSGNGCLKTAGLCLETRSSLWPRRRSQAWRPWNTCE